MPSLSGVQNVLAGQSVPYLPVRLEARSILAVEDSQDTLAALTVILEAAGYRVTGVRDGLEAARRLERDKFDLVILDLDLPGISGFRLMHLISRDKADLPVIVFTAYDYEEAMDVVRAGAADLITKPFDARELLEKVAFVLSRARAGGGIPALLN